MKNSSNKYIEDIIKQKLGEDEKLVDAIMETLAIGKESAYRRMRGEVPYTFDDIMKISTKYNISLDSIIGKKRDGAAVISTNFIDIDDPITSYKSSLIEQNKIYKDLKKRKNPSVYAAFNIIPLIFFASYYHLSKFRVYKWEYQMKRSIHQQTFSETKFPDDIWKLHQEMFNEFFSLPDINFIFDKNLFQQLVNDILMYTQLGLIDKESLGLLKNELMQLLDEVEKMTDSKPSDQVKRMFYLSNLSFESAYVCFEAENYQVSSLRVFGISNFTTRDKWIYLQQKRWIESLKRYSTLISISGGVDRFAFLCQQKEYINMLKTN